MTCEQQRNLVIERALGELDGEALAEFEAHRTSCEACNANLQRVSQLLNSIDRSVTEMVDVQPSAKFVVQLRQRLSESSPRDQEFFPRSWLPIAAGSLALVAFILLCSVRSSRLHDSNALQEPTQLAVDGPVSSPAAVPEPRAAYEGSMNRIRQLKSKNRQRRSFGQLTSTVIVPPGEWEGLAKLAADASSGRVSVDPIKVVAVRSVEPAEVVRSELPVFEIVSVAHRNSLGDDQNYEPFSERRSLVIERQLDAKERHMKFNRMLAYGLMALAIATPARGQSPAPPADEGPVTQLKLQIVLTEMDGTQKISSLPYTLRLLAATHPQKTVFKTGMRVPVRVGGKDSGEYQMQYVDVGTNIDASSNPLDSGRYELHLSVERSEVYVSSATNKPAPWMPSESVLNGDPLIAQFLDQRDLIIRDGQTIQAIIASDPVTGHLMTMDVTINAEK